MVIILSNILFYININIDIKKLNVVGCDNLVAKNQVNINVNN